MFFHVATRVAKNPTPIQFNRLTGPPMKNISCLLTVTLLSIGFTPTAKADFVFVQNVSLSQPLAFGMAHDDTNFYVSNMGSGWSVYDETFNFVSTVSAGLPNSRGMAYVPGQGNVFVRDTFDGGFVQERTPLTGSMASSYSVPSTNIQAIGYRSDTNEMIVAELSGGNVHYYSLDGILNSTVNIGSVSPTGIEYDPLNNTMLVVDNSSDSLWEFNMDGSLVGHIVPSDLISTDNGLGSDYDPSTGTFYAVGVNGNVAIWQDSARSFTAVPEPSSVAFSAILLGLFGIRRRRKGIVGSPN